MLTSIPNNKKTLKYQGRSTICSASGKVWSLKVAVVLLQGIHVWEPRILVGTISNSVSITTIITQGNWLKTDPLTLTLQIVAIQVRVLNSWKLCHPLIIDLTLKALVPRLLRILSKMMMMGGKVPTANFFVILGGVSDNNPVSGIVSIPIPSPIESIPPLNIYSLKKKVSHLKETTGHLRNEFSIIKVTTKTIVHSRSIWESNLCNSHSNLINVLWQRSNSKPKTHSNFNMPRCPRKR